ncbi:MAG TPA: hypothetical protein VHX86_00165 [Tepidisphaeraceae bacterium]|jgi:hypothetical protein|nr:hypothetical protein [Tepidisphaeraceae bacterium]
MFNFQRVVVLAAVVFCMTFAFACPAPAGPTGAVKVELRKTATGWTLLREGQPYFIQGAGGDASREMLKKCGGNSFRLWGADDIGPQLDEAQRLGLTVTVGIWLEHTGGPHHFDYHNPQQVAEQLEKVRQAVLKYKDYPAVLVWGIGNEMEGYKDGGDPAVWKAVEQAAALVHKLDPNHPTMTAIAEIGGKRVPSIDEYCPDIDIVGINTYAGGPSVARRYRQLGGFKPFILTEFGPAGTWEVESNAWGAPIELTSTAKVEAYRQTYLRTVLPERGKLCLGSYAFLWGNKQEATATWFGMFLPDGSRLEAVDTMSQFWTGHAPAHRCPQMQPMKLDRDNVKGGETIHATLNVTDPDHYPLTAKWVLTNDPAVYQTGGAYQETARNFPDAVVSGDTHGAEIHMPDRVGPYWLYAYVYDGHGGAATAVASVHVNAAGPESLGTKLPLVLYADGAADSPYIASGWMGDSKSIAVDDKCATNPHDGTDCMKCQFNAATGFGGIAWQNPANNWGDQPGGLDLSGAKKLTFWARGEEGGEVVSFKLGILGADKKFPDSDHAELPNVTLSTDWKRYSLDLTDKDLHRIETGFVWVLAASGKPVTFYLDDVQYE